MRLSEYRCDVCTLGDAGTARRAVRFGTLTSVLSEETDQGRITTVNPRRHRRNNNRFGDIHCENDSVELLYQVRQVHGKQSGNENNMSFPGDISV